LQDLVIFFKSVYTIVRWQSQH